jgi:hypothetical protein
MSSDVGEEKSEEEKAKIKAEREARKAAKEVSLVSHFYLGTAQTLKVTSSLKS